MLYSCAISGARWQTWADRLSVPWPKAIILGVYKDLLPVWNDDNLRALAEQIESRMFLAHIRATTGTAVQRANCHPFHYKNWLLMHNGVIRGFHVIKRDLVLGVSPELYTELRGTTDSEIMFYLALTFGMADDIAAAVARMAGFVERTGREHGIDDPVQMSLGISDGHSLYAFRYSTEGQSRSLFHSESIEALREIVPRAKRFSVDARAIVSEPLSDLVEAWVPVPESRFVKITAGEVYCEPFEPQPPL